MARTAQPKWPYSIPSFKKLFSQTRTTRNFRNTKHQILQGLQTNFRNKAIRNLSSHQLSPTETKVLALSLNFVPTLPASTPHLVLKSANRLTQSMKKQFHIRNQSLTNKRPTYCKPSTCAPPEILPSYIRHSKHFLQLLESLPPLPQNAI